MTCNPRWPEIDRYLIDGRSYSDLADIVVRVFHIKLTEFMDDLRNKHVLGKCKWIVKAVEFQKRGLPHAHIIMAFDK